MGAKTNTKAYRYSRDKRDAEETAQKHTGYAQKYSFGFGLRGKDNRNGVYVAEADRQRRKEGK